MRTSLLVLLILLAVGMAHADVPRMMSYQGRLTDDLGSPLSGTYDLTFTIYSDTNKIKVIWTETHGAVAVTDGLFGVMLGSNTPIDNDVFTGVTRWLAITVDGGSESPTTPIGSVGNALRSFHADTADYAHATAGGMSHWTLTDSVLSTNAPWGITKGGYNNVLMGAAIHSQLNLGYNCTTGTLGHTSSYNTVLSGYANHALANFSTIIGGLYNRTAEDNSFIAAGEYNEVNGRLGCIVGGRYNEVQGYGSFIGSGNHNTVEDSLCAIVSGDYNICQGKFSIVGGGTFNQVLGHDVFAGAVLGGRSNLVVADQAVVAGGRSNNARGEYSMIPGGYNNRTEGIGSFAAGHKAQALHNGSFVWADRKLDEWDNPIEFASTDSNQFLIRARRGVGINTNDLEGTLTIKEEVGHRTTIHLDGEYTSISWPEGEDFSLSTLSEHLTRDVVRFTSEGQIGMGTFDPQAEIHIFRGADPAFLWVETHGISEWGECGLRIETPQNRWHFRMDDNTNNNIPDGALSLRTQDANKEVITFAKSGLVGINRTDPTYQLDVNGGIRCVALVETSDQRLKHDIETIDNALDKVSLVRGVSFEWNDEVKCEDGRQLGVVAQEIEEVFPEIVSTDREGLKGVDYTKLTAVLIEAVKELKSESESLRAENEDLKRRLEKLEENR